MHPIPTEKDIKRCSHDDTKEIFIMEASMVNNDDLDEVEQEEERRARVVEMPYVDLKIMFLPSRAFMRKIIRALAYFSTHENWSESDNWMDNFGFRHY